MAAGNAGEDTSLAIQTNNQLKKLRKRPRAEQDRRNVDANLELFRSYTKGVEATVEKLQSALAEREADVTVREVASISAEARLAQKSAFLESHEARLRDWEARMRSKAAALQQWQAALQDQQERLQRLGLFNKETSSPEESDEDLEPMQIGWQRQPSHFKLGESRSWQQAGSHQTYSWKQDRSVDRHAGEDDNGEHHHRPLHHQQQEKLRMEPLTVGQDGRPRVGLRIVRSSPPPDCTAAASTSADSPSECSARAAAVFPAEEHVLSLSGPSLQHAANLTGPAVADSISQMQTSAAQHAAAKIDDVPALSPAPTAAAYPMQGGQHAPPAPAQDSHAKAEDRDNVQSMQQHIQMRDDEMLEQLADVAVTAECVSTPPARDANLGIPPKLAWKHASDHSVFNNGAPVSALQPVAPNDKRAEQLPLSNGGFYSKPPTEGVASPVFTKALDYKSCDHIMCLTKDMARHLFPPAPLSSGGGPTQLTVDLEDDSGRMWPMTYRCVPHRYSYELRAGWKAFASFWNVGVGDTVLLWRNRSGSLRISLRTASSMAATCPAAATRHASHHGRLVEA